MNQSIEDVRRFWEANPLWVGESRYADGSREFFDEHRSVVANDCFAGELDQRIYPSQAHRRRVLDLGCGPGLWTVELAQLGCDEVVGADLTAKALELARRRCDIYGVRATFCQQNAEKMSFPDGHFSHVNCQGVIHHTPDTDACLREIARVLESGGTASVSVYYRNFFLRCWPWLRRIGQFFHRKGAALQGRGRENIFAIDDVNEIVRLYDGAENPIGKAYSRADFVAMLDRDFVVQETFLHFFPARTLPFSIPQWLHRWLDRNAGFLIYANLTRR